MSKKNLGQQLADARRSAGMSQEELGEAVGASGRTVSTWETDVHMPTKRVQATIESLYGWPAGTIAYTARTQGELPSVANTFSPGQAELAAARAERTRIAQTAADALELLTERVTSLEDRVRQIESRRTSRPKSSR